jgi:hypothetical protein
MFWHHIVVLQYWSSTSFNVNDLTVLLFNQRFLSIIISNQRCHFKMFILFVFWGDANTDLCLIKLFIKPHCIGPQIFNWSRSKDGDRSPTYPLNQNHVTYIIDYKQDRALSMNIVSPAMLLRNGYANGTAGNVIELVGHNHHTPT